LLISLITNSSAEVLFDLAFSPLLIDFTKFSISSSTELASSSLLSLCGTGNSLNSGGISRGFFYITKNSSLFSCFFPVKPSLIDLHENKNRRHEKYIIIFLFIFIF
jgi:hypothetical protein